MIGTYVVIHRCKECKITHKLNGIVVQKRFFFLKNRQSFLTGEEQSFCFWVEFSEFFFHGREIDVEKCTQKTLTLSFCAGYIHIGFSSFNRVVSDTSLFVQRQTKQASNKNYTSFNVVVVTLHVLCCCSPWTEWSRFHNENALSTLVGTSSKSSSSNFKAHQPACFALLCFFRNDDDTTTLGLASSSLFTNLLY